MMKERRFDSMSAYKLVSDMIAQTDRIIERNTSVSAAIVKSASFIRDIETPAKYVASVMPMLNNSSWLQNNSIQSAVASSLAIEYPRLPTIPQWIHNINSATNRSLRNHFIAQKSWQVNMPAIYENSAIKNAIDMVSIFERITETNKSMGCMLDIAQSIARFDHSVNHLYKFINGLNEEDEDLIDIQSQLTNTFALDLESVISEDRKVIVTNVFLNLLDTLSTISLDFSIKEEQKIFLQKIKSFCDQWKKEGLICSSLTLLYLLFQPVIQHYHEKLFDMDDDIPTVVINNSKVENNYINESSFQVTTTEIKFLKEKPDNRLKVKLKIPAGTKMNIIQDKGKWIKVKLVLDGVYYSGWTLNNKL
ncbi:hypothetical protein HNP37_004272 [Flavobacterium nitrogenifigens]|uniref:SH3 domain-containing protein n=2 Tax=Flavobacterium TaxID=237 RepID=A0A7W7J0U7_9FLAO|nr:MULTISPECIES: hypothetical protein [Flavobacterium]MBB4804186.1 hypothetical protein [Flavobacterium nitrogenifigens]MBB6389145.1 hypothetical protein [Flavobacterium notoginsengisoli]